ncbi:Stress responsive alpha-beta barrel domain protein [Hirschfeldia incana]|nr:Stress responsive alpha-beta barrel domain protein [Hirschfeldia incana]KAJ0261981.1 Stress responsive alpha-beta barrel domain protein [Hirschfeldia incana]
MLLHSTMIHQALALPILIRGFGCNGGVFLHQSRTKNQGVAFCAAGDDLISSSKPIQTRKVVEHVCLLKAKESLLSEEKEKDMLDYLYTSQYQMRGIVAISVGCIGDKNSEDYTHALFVRFQRKEDLGKFYENPLFLKVLDEHVTPFCHGLTNVDYESEVEDDILSIFRKGEEYNYGEEFVLLVTFAKTASGKNTKDAMDSFAQLTSSLPSLIVQSTQGSNFNDSSKEFTHAAVVRFRSFDAMEIFVEGREYKDMWKSQFEPFIEKSVALHFSVDPVGTDVM